MSDSTPSPASTPIADGVRALGEQMAAQAPADLLAPFVAEQEVLARAGVPGGAAKPGTAMPDGKLLDAHGDATTLNEAIAGGPAVVVFYRGAWCPYCNLTLRSYQQALVADLKRRGVELVAISPQRPDGSLTMQETNELTFTVLSDPGNQLAGALGVLTEATDEAKHSQAALGLDVAAVNADGTAILPMPTTVIVDATGIIRWIDVHPDYTTRTEPAQILEALDALV